MDHLNQILNNDRIIYTVVTAPGGVDGRDHTDLGGKVVAAYFEKQQAYERVGSNSNLGVKPEVVDVSALRKKILDNLEPIERLIIDPPKGGTKRS